MDMCLCSVPNRLAFYINMTAQVQQIIVIIILAIVAVVVIRHVITRYKNRHTTPCNGCHNCPFTDCTTRHTNDEQCQMKEQNRK